VAVVSDEKVFDKLSSDEVNILCAGLVALLRTSPNRGQDVLMVRCPDARMRSITRAKMADLVDKLTVFQGATPGTHSFFAKEIAKEVQRGQRWPDG
jgi:hypothetical protein